jgi:hypothetical protein
MSKLSISTMVAALCGSVLLTACPDDTPGTGTETESSSSSSTGPMVTTVPTTMTMTTDQTTTTGVDTTVGLDDTSTSTGPSVTTTTGEDTTTTGGSTTTGEESTTGESTTSGEATTTGGESSGSTTGGPPPMDGYGDCANNDPMVVCQMGEICVGAAEGAVCTGQACVDAGDCPVPASGDAVVTCASITMGDMINDCYLNCAMGESCPDGMICLFDFVCVWPLAPGLCPDQDLGNTVPQSTMGDNTGLVDDWVSSCGDGGGEDAMYQFTAMAAGSYTFDTIGSTFDTILTILDDCAGPEIDCNDDIAMGNTDSTVTVDLAAGQTVIIVVDGYGAAVGGFTLNIDQN